MQAQMQAQAQAQSQAQAQAQAQAQDQYQSQYQGQTHGQPQGYAGQYAQAQPLGPAQAGDPYGQTYIPYFDISAATDNSDEFRQATKKSIISMTFGIISLSLTPINLFMSLVLMGILTMAVQLFSAIVAIIMSASAKRYLLRSGKATAGLVTAIVSIPLCVFIILMYFAIMTD